MTDYDELARLAREATPGPWEAYSAGEHPELNVGTVAIEGGHVAFCEEPSDTAYIAAASPDVILELLEERRVLREATQRVIEAWATATFADEILSVVEGLNAALQERTEATR